MKKSSMLWVTAFSCVLLAGIGCKKYQYGPYFSLINKTQRLEGTWKVDSAITRFGEDIRDTFATYRLGLETDGTATIDFIPPAGGVAHILVGAWSLEEEKDLFAWKDLEGDTLGFYFLRNESFDILRLTQQDFWLADKDNTFLYFSPE